MFKYLAGSGEMRSRFHWVAHLGPSISNLFGMDKFNHERTYRVTFQQFDVTVILTLPLRLAVVAALDLAKVEGALEALGGGILFRAGRLRRVWSFIFLQTCTLGSQLLERFRAVVYPQLRGVT